MTVEERLVLDFSQAIAGVDDLAQRISAATQDQSVTVTADAGTVTDAVSNAVDNADTTAEVDADAGPVTDEVSDAVGSADTLVTVTADASQVTDEISNAVANADTGTTVEALDNVADSADNAGVSVVGLDQKAKALGATFVAGFGAGEARSAFSDLDTGLREVLTLLGEAGQAPDAFSSLKADVTAFADEVGRTTAQVIPSVYQAISAGVPRDNVFDFLRTSSDLALGGVTDLGTATEALASITNAYGTENLDATETADLLFSAVRGGITTVDDLSRSLFQVVPVAASIGVEFDTVVAAVATLTSQGTPTRVATTQIRQALVELSKDGSATADVFERVAGTSFRQFIESGGTLQQALILLEGEADTLGLSIADLFGSVEAGNAVLGLTGTGAAKFAAELDNAADSAGNATLAADTLRESQDQLDRELERATERGLQAFGEAIAGLTPLMGDLVDDIAAGVEQLVPFATGLSDVVDQILRLREGAGGGGIIDSLIGDIPGGDFITDRIGDLLPSSPTDVAGVFGVTEPLVRGAFDIGQDIGSGIVDGVVSIFGGGGGPSPFDEDFVGEALGRPLGVGGLGFEERLGRLADLDADSDVRAITESVLELREGFDETGQPILTVAEQLDRIASSPFVDVFGDVGTGFVAVADAVTSGSTAMDSATEIARALGIEYADAAVALDTLTAAQDEYVASAQSTVPALGEVFSAVEDNADPAAVVAGFQAAVEEQVAFVARLNALAEAGFEDAARFVLSQGAEAGGDLAASLAADDKIAAEFDESVRATETGLASVRDALGESAEDLGLSGTAMAEAITDAFGLDLSAGLISEARLAIDNLVAFFGSGAVPIAVPSTVSADGQVQGIDTFGPSPTSVEVNVTQTDPDPIEIGREVAWVLGG